MEHIRREMTICHGYITTVGGPARPAAYVLNGKNDEARPTSKANEIPALKYPYALFIHGKPRSRIKLFLSIELSGALSRLRLRNLSLSDGGSRLSSQSDHGSWHGSFFVPLPLLSITERSRQWPMRSHAKYCAPIFPSSISTLFLQRRKCASARARAQITVIVNVRRKLLQLKRVRSKFRFYINPASSGRESDDRPFVASR